MSQKTDKSDGFDLENQSVEATEEVVDDSVPEESSDKEHDSKDEESIDNADDIDETPQESEESSEDESQDTDRDSVMIGAEQELSDEKDDEDLSGDDDAADADSDVDSDADSDESDSSSSADSEDSEDDDFDEEEDLTSDFEDDADEDMQPVAFNTERSSGRWWNRSSRGQEDDDDLIGLTEAFEAVDDEFGESGDTFSEPIGSYEESDTEDDEEQNAINQHREERGDSAGSHAGSLGYKGDTQGEYPDALESLEPKVDTPSLFFDDKESVKPAVKGGRHSKPSDKKIPPHQHKSRRMRRILIAIVILLLALIIALGYFVWQLAIESQQRSMQQATTEQNDVATNSLQDKQDDVKDVGDQAQKTTVVPSLVSLIGLTKDEAIVALERGATETRSVEVNEEGNPIKTNVTVMLAEEPADARSGTPTVYLGLDEEGKVIQAGYSAAAASLGYGSYSFADAIQNSRIVESTLLEAGATIPEGSVVLPEDKTDYTTYDSTGKRAVEERCSFSGTYERNGEKHDWSALLLYDYSASNSSGNLADVIRIIYVYVS